MPSGSEPGAPITALALVTDTLFQVRAISGFVIVPGDAPTDCDETIATAAGGDTAVVSAEVFTLNPDAARVCADGFVKLVVDVPFSVPMANDAGVDAANVQPVNVTVTVCPDTVAVGAQVDDVPKPVNGEIVGDDGTVTAEGNTTVTVDVAVKLPDDDDVKPTSHCTPVALATELVGAKVTDEGVDAPAAELKLKMARRTADAAVPNMRANSLSRRRNIFI